MSRRRRSMYQMAPCSLCLIDMEQCTEAIAWIT